MSIWWDIDIKNGVVSHDSISWMNEDFIINEDSVFDLSEDLLQITFGNQKILDVGWYTNLAGTGSFIIQVIENMNWDDPIYRFKCNDIKSVKEKIQSIFHQSELSSDIGIRSLEVKK